MKKTYLLLILSFVAVFVARQSLAQPPYPFVRYSENTVYQPDSRNMKFFFDALRELSQGKRQKVNVVHLGDSHIQADFFSGKTRELLQADLRFGNGGRGFVFPYRAAETNNPENYAVTFTGTWDGLSSVKKEHYTKWGLSGIAAVTKNANSTITIRPKPENGDYPITRVKIFYPTFDSTSFNVNVIADKKHVVSGYFSRDGYVQYDFGVPQQEITIEFSKNNDTQQEFILQGLSLENDNKGIVYHSAGVNGAEVKTYFRCEDFSRNLKVLQADLIVVSLGANDAHVPNLDVETFKNNLRLLVSEIRKVAPSASILLMTPGDAYYRKRTPNQNNNKAREQILELATEIKIAVWDFYRVMGGFRSSDKWYKNKLCASDMLHLTPKGYLYQGELFYDALKKSYEDYLNGN